MEQQQQGLEERALVDCAEALRKLSPEDPLEYMYRLIAEGRIYLEWVKSHDSCNTSRISVLTQRIRRAEFFSLEKEKALEKAGGQKK